MTEPLYTPRPIHPRAIGGYSDDDEFTQLTNALCAQWQPAWPDYAVAAQPAKTKPLAVIKYLDNKRSEAWVAKIIVKHLYTCGPATLIEIANASGTALSSLTNSARQLLRRNLLVESVGVLRLVE